MTSAHLAFDSGPGVGLGHQRRVEAVAAELHDLGVQTSLTPVSEAASADIVLVDSYAVRADEGDRFAASVLGAIDDLERNLAVDLVVDPNPPSALGPPGRAGVVLAGPRYAPLPRFDTEAPPIATEVTAVLVTTGAADQAGIGQDVAGALAALLPEVAVRLVLGPWGNQAVPPGVEPLRATAGLQNELGTADVVVTAGGVTLLEALRLGRPTVALVTAPNQHRAVTGAIQAGAAVRAEPGDAACVAARLTLDLDGRRRLSETARLYVDGAGARRVANALLALLRRKAS